VEEKRVYKHLKDFAIAGLISEGDYDIFSKSPVLKIPIIFTRRKITYLHDIIKEMKPFIDINIKKGQLNVSTHSVLKELREQWYEGNVKIYSKYLDPNLITVESIIICANLFGIRRLENITIPTSVSKDYIRGLAFCIERHLKAPVIPGKNQIKITNIPFVATTIIREVPTIHSVEFLHFLTESEKRKIVEGECYA